MSRSEDTEALREAFQGMADSSGRGGSEPIEPDLVWSAVAGEIPAAQRRALVERLAEDPEAAESWRLARELQEASESHRGKGEARSSVSVLQPWHRWVAAAAALVLAAFLGLLVLRQISSEEQAPIYRNADELAVRTELPDRATVPRVAAVLSWGLAGVPPEMDLSEVRYTLRVQLPDLAPLATVRDLAAPRYQLPQEILLDLSPGQELLWQVEAHLSDGSVVASRTFVVQLQ